MITVRSHRSDESEHRVPVSADPITLAYHELRAPLGLIVMQARQAAEEADELSVRVRCEAIARGAERMLRTASAVFAVEQAVDQGVERSFAPVELASSLIADLQQLGVPLVFTSSPAAAGSTAHTVPERFEALVQSLITNGMDHGVEGEPVQIDIDVRDGALLVLVSNRHDGSCRHRGLGTGRHLAGRLAELLQGSLDTMESDGCYVARLRLPFTAAELQES